MTITSVVLPNWVSYHVRHKPGNGGKEIILDDRFGLHQRCTNTLGCFTFPEEHRCEGSERSLCTMWRTTGFLMSLAVVVDLASLVGFWVIMAGGKVKRERGWKILGVMMIGAGVIQFFAMAVVVSITPPPFVLMVDLSQVKPQLTTVRRATSSTTTTSSTCLATISTRHGICAPSAPSSPSCALSVWPSLHMYCLVRMDTNFSRISIRIPITSRTGSDARAVTRWSRSRTHTITLLVRC